MKKNLSKKKIIGIIVSMLIVFSIVANESKNGNENKVETNSIVQTEEQNKSKDVINPTSVVENIEVSTTPTPTEMVEQINKDQDEEQLKEQTKTVINNSNSIEYDGKTYEIVEVDGGSLSGERLPNVAVDIGFGDRVYWGLTNEYEQLVHVIADKIILQDDENEPVNSNGRYYSDEAKVSGTEKDNLDEGHVIADSLGGVSNAYNITPQESTLNRHGDQAYMEKVIRDAGGCKNFIATITYPDNSTQIPSKYKYEYVLMGNKVVDEFENVNPDVVNSNITAESKEEIKQKIKEETTGNSADKDKEIKTVDTNGNGKVTIKEAKDAGYKMPITSDHWLYKYMDDRDGDGKVGE